MMRPATMSLHGDSHRISKLRPKIKIIHIVAPEIIKTDVENFRELVQRLTGKQAAAPPASKRRKSNSNGKTTTMAAPRHEEEKEEVEVIKCEVKVEEGAVRDYDGGGREVWNMEANGLGGFLSFLEEEEGEESCFFQGIGADFLRPLGASRMDLVGEAYAS